MATYHMRNWSVSSDAFAAPELRRVCLAGTRAEDGKEVVTSAIVDVEGNRITTASGSIYILEDIDPVYVEWMKENNIPYNPDEPIRFKGKK